MTLEKSDDRIQQEADRYALENALSRLLDLLVEKGVFTAEEAYSVFSHSEDKLLIRKADEMSTQLREWGPEKFNRETGCTIADIKYLYARDKACQRLSDQKHGRYMWWSSHRPQSIKSKLMKFLTSGTA